MDGALEFEGVVVGVMVDVNMLVDMVGDWGCREVMDEVAIVCADAVEGRAPIEKRRGRKYRSVLNRIRSIRGIIDYRLLEDTGNWGVYISELVRSVIHVLPKVWRVSPPSNIKSVTQPNLMISMLMINVQILLVVANTLIRNRIPTKRKLKQIFIGKDMSTYTYIY
jgi:hypothetical protein